MKRHGWNGTAAVLIAAMVWATLPAAPARAESGEDSMGASIAVGLMVAVVAVYALVSLRSDVERYSQAEVDAVIARAAKAAEESSVVLQAVTAPVRLDSPGADPQAEIAGVAVGWRMSF